jgi:hypothetical protein
MKTIQIRKDTIEQTKNMICVNGNHYKFTSKRALNKFIASINKDCTSWIIELNEIYIQVFTEYRRAWFIMRSYKGSNLRTESICLTHLQAVEDRFTHITNMRGGAFILFVDIKKICLFLSTCCNEIERLHFLKNNTMQRHQIKIINKRLCAITYEINNYKPVY